ncbi:MAG TPA: hypothetical protein GX717_06620 [Clostridiaceae bacterium]|nr:hypothetical protein [Clostridiaceae bacterium]
MNDILLEMLQNGEHIAVSELADTLQTSPEMVLAMLEHYERLGFVKKTVIQFKTENSSCGGCAGCVHLKQRDGFTLWEKGERLKLM